MNELIKVTDSKVGAGQAQTVNARELHAFLGSKVRFNDWIKKRIADFGFQDGFDFVRFELQAGMKMAENGGEIGGVASSQKNVALQSMGYESSGQQGRIEYAITLDMAKELAMVERNAKGKQARQYFIECERRAKAVDPVAMLNDPAAMRGLLLSYSEKVIALEAENRQIKPKADALDRIANTDGSFCIRDAAKNLQVQESRLRLLLCQRHWIYRRPMGTSWLAYSDKIQQGLMEHKVTQGEKGDGSTWTSTQARITAKGMARLAEQISGAGSMGMH